MLLPKQHNNFSYNINNNVNITNNITSNTNYLYPFNIIEIVILGSLILLAVIVFIVHVCKSYKNRRYLLHQPTQKATNTLDSYNEYYN